jgi:thiopeptide-type bacteriocin biosynthesis protein
MDIKRRFFIGDNWLYFKIYSGPQKLDDILINQVHNIVRALYIGGKISKFFFIRYHDDGYHLRLRFLLSENKFLSEVIGLVHDAFAEDVRLRVISRISTDTYNREIERYGAQSIEQAEALFSLQSWSCLAILNEFVTNDSDRWLYSLLAFDRLLTQFGLSFEEKQKFCQNCFRAMSGNAVEPKSTIVALDKKYREHSPQILHYLEVLNLNEEIWQHPQQVTDAVQLALEFKTVVQSAGEVTFFEVVNSLSHMLFNRFFRTKQPKNEMVAYYLMAKYYKSREARLKYAVQTNLTPTKLDAEI